MVNFILASIALVAIDYQMKLSVFSHKLCWPSADSPGGYATDGGFPMQMRALSELFDQTTLVVPVSNNKSKAGEMPITGHNIRIVPLSNPAGQGLRRKLSMINWLITNGWTIFRQTLKSDAVHVPIPGDVGTIGMLLAWLLRKPLCVRYCGNWFIARTAAEKFWQWFMVKTAGGRTVMLATGGDANPPSESNPNVRWIFSTSLTEQEIAENGKVRELSDTQQARLIIVCRQERGKGTDVVIEALSKLSPEFPALKLDVVGDGEALDQFKQLTAELGVSARVSFHGKVNHDSVMKLLRRADLFCYPTGSEGFPKVVLEAMACGLPVMTTRVSILPQLVGNGSGILLEAATPEKLAGTIRECLSDGEKYRAMSAQAIATARQYSLENWRDTIGAILREAWGQELKQASWNRASATRSL